MPLYIGMLNTSSAIFSAVVISVSFETDLTSSVVFTSVSSLFILAISFFPFFISFLIKKGISYAEIPVSTRIIPSSFKRLQANIFFQPIELL